MENAEEVLQVLERFTKLKQKEIPKELDDYLLFVAKTGDTVYRWPMIKQLFHEKLVNVITDFHDTSPSIVDLQYPNVDPFNYENMKKILLERLDSFNAAPFTVQRICELLADPKKQYTRIDKFMRAVEKNILVVSTQEPGRVTESENGDSFDSLANRDLELDVDIDYDFDTIETRATNRENHNNGLINSNDEEASTSKENKENENEVGVDPLLTDVKVDIITGDDIFTHAAVAPNKEIDEDLQDDKIDTEDVELPAESTSELLNSIIDDPDKCLPAVDENGSNIEDLVSVTMSIVTDTETALSTVEASVAEIPTDDLQTESTLDILQSELDVVAGPELDAITATSAEVTQLEPLAEKSQNTTEPDNSLSSGSSSSSSEDFYSNLETPKEISEDEPPKVETDVTKITENDQIEKNVPCSSTENKTVLEKDVPQTVVETVAEVNPSDIVVDNIPTTASAKAVLDPEIIKSGEEQLLLAETPKDLILPPMESGDSKLDVIPNPTATEDISIGEEVEAPKPIAEADTPFQDITEINLPAENIMATDEEDNMLVSTAAPLEAQLPPIITEEIEKDAMDVDESSGEPMDQ